MLRQCSEKLYFTEKGTFLLDGTLRAGLSGLDRPVEPYSLFSRFLGLNCQTGFLIESAMLSLVPLRVS